MPFPVNSASGGVGVPRAAAHYSAAVEERWTVFVNGQASERVVDVVAVAEFLDPACTCGSLCMGRYRFWYEHAGSLFTVDADRIGLDWAIEEFMEAAPPTDYATFPRLVRDWSEGNGWCGLEEHFGSAVTTGEVADFADALRPYIGDAFASALQRLARRAATLKAPMKAMTDLLRNRARLEGRRSRRPRRLGTR
jgi:hypothetical protein